MRTRATFYCGGRQTKKINHALKILKANFCLYVALRLETSEDKMSSPILKIKSDCFVVKTDIDGCLLWWSWLFDSDNPRYNHISQYKWLKLNNGE